VIILGIGIHPLEIPGRDISPPPTHHRQVTTAKSPPDNSPLENSPPGQLSTANSPSSSFYFFPSQLEKHVLHTNHKHVDKLNTHGHETLGAR
jgi:hypothetical protein